MLVAVRGLKHFVVLSIVRICLYISFYVATVEGGGGCLFVCLFFNGGTLPSDVPLYYCNRIFYYLHYPAPSATKINF